tara:strand:+ start:236 stop:640 length:405 start_codon:yes stop_codon:yes gene_type:complete
MDNRWNFSDDEYKSAGPIACTAAVSNFGVESRGEGWIISSEKHEHLTYFIESLRSLNIPTDITRVTKNMAYVEKRFSGCGSNVCNKLLDQLKILKNVTEYSGDKILKRKQPQIVIKPNSKAFMDIVNNIKRMKN